MMEGSLNRDVGKMICRFVMGPFMCPLEVHALMRTNRYWRRVVIEFVTASTSKKAFDNAFLRLAHDHALCAECDELLYDVLKREAPAELVQWYMVGRRHTNLVIEYAATCKMVAVARGSISVASTALLGKHLGGKTVISNALKRIRDFLSAKVTQPGSSVIGDLQHVYKGKIMAKHLRKHMEWYEADVKHHRAEAEFAEKQKQHYETELSKCDADQEAACKRLKLE